MGIDKWSTEPLYQQLAADLRGRFERDEIKRGEQLPAEPQLMADYEVSRSTVRQAIEVLINEGLVSRHPGRGTFRRR